MKVWSLNRYVAILLNENIRNRFYGNRVYIRYFGHDAKRRFVPACIANTDLIHHMLPFSVRQGMEMDSQQRVAGECFFHIFSTIVGLYCDFSREKIVFGLGI